MVTIRFAPLALGPIFYQYFDGSVAAGLFGMVVAGGIIQTLQGDMDPKRVIKVWAPIGALYWGYGYGGYLWAFVAGTGAGIAISSVL